MSGTPVRVALAALVFVTTPDPGQDLARTLSQAQQLIDQDKSSAAIRMLEQALPDAKGNDQVLVLLRRAYRVEVRNLVLKGEHKVAEKYLDRLRLIEQPAGDQPVKVIQPRENLPTHSRSAPNDVPSVRVLRVGPATGATGDRAKPENPVGSGATDKDDSLVSSQSEQDRPSPQADANQAGDAPQAVLRQADALFTAHRYLDAAPLYDKLHRTAPDLLDRSHDRWIYCRLVVVADQINHPTRSAEEWSLIKAELESVIPLVPRNEYALSLLRIAERQDRPAAVARAGGQPIIRANSPDQSDEREKSLLAGLAARIGVGRNSDGTKRSPRQRSRSGAWQVLETSNFRIYHTDDALAGPAADIAECTRIELYRTWFGRVPESNWSPKCDIYLHSSTDAYVRATGQGPSSPGHSATGLDRGRVLSRRIDLRRDGPDLIQAVLPHEITHVVMADRFTVRPLPRWADEGMAVLTEPPEKILAHLRNLTDWMRSNRLYSARQLMTLGDYPPGNLWPLFYAQSVSLVEFLAERGGPDKFVEFMSRSLQSGYEAELKRSYGFASFDDLDREWSQQRATQLATATGTVQR